MPLLGPEYNENHRAKWEDASLDPALDELDRMSLELHQRFRAAAEEVRRRGPLGGEDMAALRGRDVGAPYLPNLPPPEGAALEKIRKAMKEAGLI